MDEDFIHREQLFYEDERLFEIKQSSLHLMALDGNLEMVKYLLKNGANSKAIDLIGRTPLHCAVQAGHYHVVKYLSQTADISAIDENGCNPLHYASMGDYLDIVEYLLTYNIDINTKDTKGLTALHYASKYNNFNIVQCLLNHGADLELKDNYGYTAFVYGALSNSIASVDILLDHGLKTGILLNVNPIIKIHEYREYDIDTDLIEYNYDTDYDNWCCDTIPNYYTNLIFIIVERGYFQITKLLLAHDKNYHIRDEKGYLLLHYAEKYKHLEILRYLLFLIDPKEKEYDGTTCLYYAIIHGFLDIVKYLVALGADPKEKSNYGSTCLHYATSHGYLDIVKYLIALGADPEEKSKYGSTPFTLAVYWGHTEIVKYLLDFGIKNINHKFPLHEAILKNNIEIIKYLLQYGADFELKYYSCDEWRYIGKTPFEMTTNEEIKCYYYRLSKFP